jgi:hypothetical protein
MKEMVVHANGQMTKDKTEMSLFSYFLPFSPNF